MEGLKKKKLLMTPAETKSSEAHKPGELARSHEEGQ